MPKPPTIIMCDTGPGQLAGGPCSPYGLEQLPLNEYARPFRPEEFAELLAEPSTSTVRGEGSAAATSSQSLRGPSPVASLHLCSHSAEASPASSDSAMMKALAMMILPCFRVYATCLLAIVRPCRQYIIENVGLNTFPPSSLPDSSPPTTGGPNQSSA